MSGILYALTMVWVLVLSVSCTMDIQCPTQIWTRNLPLKGRDSKAAMGLLVAPIKEIIKYRFKYKYHQYISLLRNHRCERFLNSRLKFYAIIRLILPSYSLNASRVCNVREIPIRDFSKLSVPVFERWLINYRLTRSAQTTHTESHRI